MKLLREQLKTVYSTKNLNKITQFLIESYRNKQIDILAHLYNAVDSSTEEISVGYLKPFNYLIQIYHPDRLQYYLKKIDQYFEDGKPEKLHKLLHIQTMLDLINQSVDKVKSGIQIADFSEYDDSIDTSEFDHVYDQTLREMDQADSYSETIEFDFISALKHKEFGRTDLPLDALQLNHLDGFLDLSGMNIVIVDGIEACCNLTGLDLSNNQLADITAIGFLGQLIELDLSENNIDDISALATVVNLQSLDISFNSLADVSALFELPFLKYVNLIGNNVPLHQIDELKKSGLLVVS